ncbi:MAG: TRAP transporter substrate-binding protein [Rhodospirillales bacterium]|nr:TRAP transporter substrate-binding protein [Rhodospirillales bacterium]
MRRRTFLKNATSAGAGGVAAGIAAPALAQGRLEWRLVTTWPKNLPGLGTAPELLAQMIGKASDGRLTVRVFGSGELVPPFEALDAVATGTVEMGHGSPFYWKGRIPAVQFLTTFPFGLLADEQNAWYQHGGGLNLAGDIYRQMGCKFFPCGNTGPQMGGWFNREINAIGDFKGLKMRIPGLGGAVVSAAGGEVVTLPGAEIPSALESGALDAAEWVGPYNDLAFGLYKSARYYYYPGWHEPGSTLDCFINAAVWEKLPSDLQAIVEHACGAVNQMVLSEFNARNGSSLRILLDDHKVQLRRFPDTVLQELGKLSGEVLTDLGSKDPLSRSVLDSLLKFRAEQASWSALAEQSFLEARSLPYTFARPTGN